MYFPAEFGGKALPTDLKEQLDALSAGMKEALYAAELVNMFYLGDVIWVIWEVVIRSCYWDLLFRSCFLGNLGGCIGSCYWELLFGSYYMGVVIWVIWEVVIGSCCWELLFGKCYLGNSGGCYWELLLDDVIGSCYWELLFRSCYLGNLGFVVIVEVVGCDWGV